LSGYFDKGLTIVLDTSKAGCQLTWEYFTGKPDELDPAPFIVKLLADYDMWEFKFGDLTETVQAYVNAIGANPQNEKVWKGWLSWEVIPDYVLEQGYLLKQNDRIKNESACDEWAFYAIFEGYKAICCNVRSGSKFFDSVDPDTYQLKMPFVFDGTKFTVSIYFDKGERSYDIDCSELAERFGGGGHPGASGFQCETLPFAKNEKYVRKDREKKDD
jgi:hypothetical protein